MQPIDHESAKEYAQHLLTGFAGGTDDSNLARAYRAKCEEAEKLRVLLKEAARVASDACKVICELNNGCCPLPYLEKHKHRWQAVCDLDEISVEAEAAAKGESDAD